MQVEACVEHPDRFGLVTLDTPLNHSLKEEVFCGFIALLCITQLCKELQLVLSIVNHLLLHPAEDHSVKRLQVTVIVLTGLLEDLVRALVVAKKCLLVANLSVVSRVLRTQHQSNVQDLEGAIEHKLFAAAVAREEF